ncbi:MAG: glycosyltransferase family 4 protein [Winogradskyella sp.]|uniref:glycosyltransferase family 4 protein n=1 Tax=Winogradskyella sp. TaxID=1883156 RepID=UPI0038588448
MKINIKIRLFPQPTETFIISHIIGLINRGICPKIYTNYYRGIEAFKNPEKLKKYDIDSLVHKNFKLNTKLPKVLQIFKIISNFKILKFAFRFYRLKLKWSLEPFYHLYNYRDFEEDLLCHVQFNTSLKPLIELSEIGYLNPKKLIITFHGYDAFRLTKEVYHKTYSKFYTNHVKAVTVNSNYIKKHLLSVGVSASIIHVIPVGIDVDAFTDLSQKLNKQDDHIRLVTVGRLIQLKGHKYGIRVLKKLLDMGYNASYTIVGDGRETFKKTLIAEVIQQNCEKNVIFTGYQPQEEIKKILLTSSLFLMTSTQEDLTKREEALGLVAVEAQACGLPVIAFDTGGVSETIVNGYSGFLVEDRNVNAMVQKVISLTKDVKQFKQMGQNAREHAFQNFDNLKLIDQYIKIYKQLG